MATELALLPDVSEQCLRCQNLVLEWPATPIEEPFDRRYVKDLGPPSSWSGTCRTCQTFRNIIRNIAIDERAHLVPVFLRLGFLISSPTTNSVKGWQIEGQKSIVKNWTDHDCYFDRYWDLCRAPGTILEQPNPALPLYVNIPNIRHWIDHCKDNEDPKHRYCNRPLPRLPRNLRVIDCQQRTIVSQPEGASYIALSYVWGNVPANRLEFNQADDSRQEESSIGDSGVPDSKSQYPLPQLILDSMKVTLDLGYRYLWIDRYCINQSDDSEKQVQIDQMDLVYTGAAATIIAAEGQDPNDGLPGVSVPRQPAKAFKIGRTSCYVSSELDLDFQKRKWGTRAWTYQEGELSSRRIVFLKDSVYVTCREGHAGAGCESPRAVPTYSRFNDYDIVKSGDGALNCIWEHIEEYSYRSLSYPADVVNAVTGIFKFRSQITPSLYTFSGLPALEEDSTTCLSSLMWFKSHNGHAKGTSQRRQGYPSWSWLGVTGGVSSPNTRSMLKPKYHICAEIQAVLEDGTITAPGTSIRTSNASRSMLPIQELVAHGVFIKDLHFQPPPSVEREPKWKVQLLPGHKFPYEVLTTTFFSDLNEADMGTGEEYKALLLFAYYEKGRALPSNRTWGEDDHNGYTLQLLVLKPSTTKKPGAWERVGALWLFVRADRTNEGPLMRLEESGCVSRENITLV